MKKIFGFSLLTLIGLAIYNELSKKSKSPQEINKDLTPSTRTMVNSRNLQAELLQAVQAFDSAALGIFELPLQLNPKDFISFLARTSPPSYFYFITANTLEKSLWAVESWLDYLDRNRDTGIRWAQQQEIIEQQSMHQRRLVELLILLILLQDSGNDEYIRHYIQCTDLDWMAAETNDLKDFFGASFSVLRRASRVALRRLQTTESGISLNGATYLQKGIRGTPSTPKLSRKSRKFESPRSILLDDILPTIRPPFPELVAIGHSYQSIFGSTSQDIHLNYSSFHSRFQEREQVEFGIEFVQFQVVTILLRLYSLIGFINMNTIHERLARRYNPDNIVSLLMPELQQHPVKLNDLVIVMEPTEGPTLYVGRVDQILPVQANGFRSFIVVSRSPIRADRVPAHMLRVLCRQGGEADLQNEIAALGIPLEAELEPMIFKVIDERLIPALIQIGIRIST